MSAGSRFDWHNQPGVDEMFVVLKERGKFYCEDSVADYEKNDIFSIHAGAQHKIAAESNSPSDFFVRIKV